MDSVLERPAVQRVRAALERHDIPAQIHVRDDSARSAAEAAATLGVAVGQIASSIVFRLPDGHPLLVITSGRHRVDATLVAQALHVDHLGRADADYVKAWSGFSIGGVSPLGWVSAHSTGTTERGLPAELTVVIDVALADYDVIWAAAGHPHAVFATTFAALRDATGAEALTVTPD